MSAILDFTLHAIGISHFDLIENDKFDLHQQTQKADGYVLVYDYFTCIASSMIMWACAYNVHVSKKLSYARRAHI